MGTFYSILEKWGGFLGVRVVGWVYKEFLMQYSDLVSLSGQE